ncbi:type IV pilus modification PilV family protein [Paenibacillus sp. sgz302251]|uniref:type IV pilus modification PilV family protein n=1 Tax=Paenibacillus sp. sgz302251 TaxID=3414493 RepID=UPI003C7C4E1B
MKMRKKLAFAGESEAGFTLVEVLAAFTILSIVAIAMTSFFSNALTYAKDNQSKTVMVNLARNVLFYMEKQKFEPIEAYFKEGDQANTEISCAARGCEAEKLVSNGDQLFDVLTPTVNGITYTITIEYQKDITARLEGKMSNFLLPINVIVKPLNGRNNARDITMVEGYITNEKIR